MRFQSVSLRFAGPPPCPSAGLVGVCRRPSPAYSMGLGQPTGPPPGGLLGGLPRRPLGRGLGGAGPPLGGACYPTRSPSRLPPGRPFVPGARHGGGRPPGSGGRPMRTRVPPTPRGGEDGPPNPRRGLIAVQAAPVRHRTSSAYADEPCPSAGRRPGKARNDTLQSPRNLQSDRQGGENAGQGSHPRSGRHRLVERPRQLGHRDSRHQAQAEAARCRVDHRRAQLQGLLGEADQVGLLEHRDVREVGL